MGDTAMHRPMASPRIANRSLARAVLLLERRRQPVGAKPAKASPMSKFRIVGARSLGIAAAAALTGVMLTGGPAAAASPTPTPTPVSTPAQHEHRPPAAAPDAGETATV